MEDQSYQKDLSIAYISFMKWSQKKKKKKKKKKKEEEEEEEKHTPNADKWLKDF